MNEAIGIQAINGKALSVLDKSELFMEVFTHDISTLINSWFRNDDLIVQQKKHPLDLVSNADQLASETFIKRLTDTFPNHGYICEEGGSYNTDKDFVWIIDPLDGTLNFIKGMPDYAIIIGLQYQGQMVSGCVEVPSRNEFYYAEQGKGAFLNGQQIKCSSHSTINNSLGLTNDTVTNNRLNYLNQLRQYEPRSKFWASSLGCTGVSCGYTAEGRKDWYLCSGGGGIWDYAGTIFLLQSSGCVVTAPDGSPWKHGDGPFIAANPVLHEQLVNAFTFEESEAGQN